MKEIVLDTETTGLDPVTGDRIVEIGAVELWNHLPTGKTFHKYLNPERNMPEEAQAVHGLTEEFLKDKPVFSQIADDFLTFIKGSKLVIHNASFDMKFINLSAEIKVDKPTIYSLKPLNEIKIIKDNKILWREIATSSKKIEGPINWPLDPIERGDQFKLSLRAEGASLGSEVNINLIADEKEKLNDLDEIVYKLGDSKSSWIKSINKNIKIDKDTGLTLLFSGKAPKSKELQKVKLDLSKEDRCE